MAPESQTLFSITLFLALSSLLEWQSRRQRGASRNGNTAMAAVGGGDHSAKLQAPLGLPGREFLMSRNLR